MAIILLFAQYMDLEKTLALVFLHFTGNISQIDITSLSVKFVAGV
jgi:hypothetical protein